MKNKLLSRENFKLKVFERDECKCVFCRENAQDAHHLIDKSLWDDGGYYLDNGISVCHKHYEDCEKTLISIEDARKAANINNIVLPEHFYENEKYDKWGNIVLLNGQRIKGELFFNENVQKALKEVLHLFADEIKYPRTNHMPWSAGLQNDDRVIHNMNAFSGKRVIVTEKMDGENTTLYRHTMHARSVDSRHHESRNWVKSFWAGISQEIPNGWRICGENLYAKHSIKYENLSTYFMGFSIWNEKNECLSWDETIEWFNLIGITPVNVLYDGLYDEKLIKKICNSTDIDVSEGNVMRLAESIKYIDFKCKVAKFVRKGHVQTNEHWMTKEIEKNLLNNKKLIIKK